jgi:hypothetical protein
MHSKSEGPVSRREILRASSALLMGGAVVSLLSGCSKSATQVCSDPSRLGESEMSLRASLDYQEQSPNPDQACGRCGFFESQVGEACGTCTLLKGSVNPRGHCNSWSSPHKTG